MKWEPQGLGLTIFQDRYARFEGETWEQACKRVATHVAAAEDNGKAQKYGDRFEQELVDNRFMPGGRIWYGSGRPKAQLLNCFVVPTSDSREGWGKTISDVIVVSGTGEELESIVHRLGREEAILKELVEKLLAQSV